MINLTVNYHRPSTTVDSQTLDGTYLVEDQVVPNGVNGLAKRHVVVFRQRRIKKNKYMAMAAIIVVVIVLLIAGVIAGMYHPGFETDHLSSSQPISSSIPATPKNGLPPSPSQPECGTRPGYGSRHKRVIHGRASETGEWPWQVLVRVGSAICGGVIVSPDWVFTAGHCVLPDNLPTVSSSIVVVAGMLHMTEQEEGTQVRSVARHVIHPRYAQESHHFNYDIALIRVNESFVINDVVRPICLDGLPDDELYAPGKQCVVAGWGFTSARESYFDSGVELSYAEIPLIGRDKCLRWASAHGRRAELQVTPQRICAGYEDKRLQRHDISVPCKGDSGSPLVCQDSASGSWQLVGLVSSGQKCGEVSFFTNVSAMYDFWRIFRNESAIPPKEFECSDGSRSIVRELMCNGVPDCDDMSDETFCQCTDRQFQCDNKMCILEIRMCDTTDDCGDGSDERGCSYFNCSNGGQRVANSSVCDGHFDCDDRSDESNAICAVNSATHFACPEGLRVPHSWICDGFQDCLDGEDETNCNCTEYQFACDNRCIPKDHVCDNVVDCVDRTDEKYCECSDDMFLCAAAGVCWHKEMKEYCDNYQSYNTTCHSMNVCGLLDYCSAVHFEKFCEGLKSILDNRHNVTLNGNGG
ncbi:uncharacterized protein [Diadema setosum]|uniref:uncharacterized protein n=1 Tax=Diadema setosum TaxID=31175 RepID=UPI003B3A99D1